MAARCCLVLALLLAVAVAQASGAAWRARAFARLHAANPAPCAPSSVPSADRCAYVRDHADICYPGGGFQEYLVLHYCTFGPSWQWLSLLVLAAAAVLAFAVLMTVSERFFCPALELISDYLKLPPVVAGATLLSFGNGAPDTFTQVAAVAQEGGAAVGMALAEPLGGGLFASNVVLGMVVLMASGKKVFIPRRAFLKDAGFYLVSLLVIAFLLADGKVTMPEAGIMCSLYVVFVCVTFYATRADEPLHADVALHEVPPVDGGVDAPDGSSEEFSDSESHSSGPGYVDATTSVHAYDLEAPRSEAAASFSSSSPPESDPPPLRRQAAAAAAGAKRGSLPGGGGGGEAIAPAGGSRTLQALLSWKQRGSAGGGHGCALREPLLVRIEESPARTSSGCGGPSSAEYEANSSGDTVVGGHLAAASAAAPAAALEPVPTAAAAAAASSIAVGPDAAAAPADAPSGAEAGAAAAAAPAAQAPAAPGARASDPGQRVRSRGAALPSPVFARGSQGFTSPTGPAPPGALQQQPPSRDLAVTRSRHSFSEGVRLRAQAPAGDGCAAPGEPVSPRPLLHSPRTPSDSALVDGPFCARCTPLPSPEQQLWQGGGRLQLHALAGSPLTPRHSASTVGSASGALSPRWHQLQQQHAAEQAELLEQQAAEQVALLAAHEDEEEDHQGGGGTSLKQRLQHPLVLLLSCTMPRVGTGSGHRYARWRACLLPVTVPLMWLLTDARLLAAVGWPGALLAAACAAVGSAIIWATYPSSHVPRKSLKGVFAVLAFLQAIVWLDISASALVQVCVVVGVIFGLPPALLGATVLAYSNSVPDLVNGMTMCRDGFPSMAVAACFASPLFTLLVGMGGALAYGTVLHGGTLLIPVDGPLLIMAGFAVVNVAQHLIVVPWVHGYRMRPSLAIPMFVWYAAFNVVYGLASVGVIRVQ